MARAMMYSLKSLGLTKSMTVDFIKPVRVGKEIMVEGRILEVKEGEEAIAEGIIYDEKGNVCSRSTGTYTLFSPHAIKRKGVSSDKVMEWFERFIQVM
jgi:acyl-coenzyme A thioesterase PaaI-like protein